MMSKTTRALCGFLAALMLLGTLASCAETKNPTETDSVTGSATEADTAAGATSADATSADTSADAAGTDAADTESSDSETEGQSAAETEEQRIEDDIPEGTTFGNQEVVILSRYREGWTAGEIAVEALNNDLINDTVYERNKAVEERLQITIKSIEDPDHDPAVAMNRVTTAVSAGTHEYDLIACACYVSINQALEGTFMDLRKTAYLDLDKPWWSQGFNEAVEYKGIQFVATGSVMLSMYRFAFVTVFNKDIFTDNEVPYLYDDVRNSTWTLDRQTEMVQTFHRDNGNGEQDLVGDVYGLATNDYLSVDPYWSSCDVAILGRDETGAYELIFDSSKLHAVAEKVIKLLYGSGDAVYNHEHYGLHDEQVHIRDMFATNGAAMATLRILELENGAIRNMTSEYGVVPMPKYDNEQKEYHTFLHDQVTVFSIPSTVAKDEDRWDMLGAVMEALASNSHYTLRPAYYETTLRTKIAQDPESAEMMRVVFNNVYIDAGILYMQASNSFQAKFRQVMGSGVNSVTSSFKSVVTSAERRYLPNILEKLNKLTEE